MIVLDTNVVSEFMRAEPLERVVTWADAQPPTNLFITAITLAELLDGVGRRVRTAISRRCPRSHLVAGRQNGG